MNGTTREKVNILSRKHLDISYYIGPGAGGQNRQKNHTGVQLVHRETGAIGRCHDTRSREQNRKLAFRRLIATPKMKVWLNAKVFEIREGESLEAKIQRWVDKQMAPENLKIEYYDPNL